MDPDPAHHIDEARTELMDSVYQLGTELEATPRIELGMEVLQFAASLSRRCNWGQPEYEPGGLEVTPSNQMQGVRQLKWQLGFDVRLEALPWKARPG